MKAKVKDTKVIAALRRRIRRFYQHLNACDFAKCYQMVDPELRAAPGNFPFEQYASSLQCFIDHVGRIRLRHTKLTHIHLNQPNRLYNNRDFASVRIAWEDSNGQGHTFKSRWVRGSDGRWYNRSVGFVVFEAAEHR